MIILIFIFRPSEVGVSELDLVKSYRLYARVMKSLHNKKQQNMQKQKNLCASPLNGNKILYTRASSWCYGNVRVRNYREYSTSNNNTIKEFWNQFYRDIEANTIQKGGIDMYNSKVFSILNEYKKVNQSNKTWNPTENELISLQTRIENLTMTFDDKSIFKDTPNLIKLLIGKDPISAKLDLYKNIPTEIYNSTIAQFGEYTLEAIIIHVLGVAFHSVQESSAVRVSTLLGLLHRTVITQANMINNNQKECSRVDSSKDGDIKHKKGTQFEIGRKLLEFMIERQVIRIESLSADNKKAVVKEKGKGYIEYNLFAVCNFDLSYLPLKLNLPMVCKPIDWVHPTEEELYQIVDLDVKKPYELSDMRGGYLSGSTKVIFNMDHPLRIINEFMKINLILPYSHTHDIYNLYNHKDNEPLPSDYLTDFLNSLSPVKDKKKWRKMVSDFLNCYNRYVDAVCGNQVIDSEEPSNDVKWNKFKQLLENRSQNYSAHY
uniref:Uncharacterized protein n=1 Tax=Mirabilis jalapa TaxID=3538 RepID=A0A7T7FPF0_MIRJA|nr:hypothetical protein KYW51_mgp25 [Mirabilis jalapa]QQL93531.1 hypothetical protein [Mirabilis jalapa]